MGCEGCELWPTVPQLAASIQEALHLPAQSSKRLKNHINHAFNAKLPTDIYQSRKALALHLAEEVTASSTELLGTLAVAIETAIQSRFQCYAGILHTRHGSDESKPEKKTSPGYATKFEIVKLFPGRMGSASHWSDLRGHPRPEKPWMDGLPRLIFISDMGDSFCTTVPFEYLRSEVIDTVDSESGRQHIWLWLTKRPRRMAEFSQWLHQQGVLWPDHLVAMTTVTSTKTLNRVEQLRQVDCKIRGLSVEPLWNQVDLPLEGIDWCIVGGESGTYAQRFDIAWAKDIVNQCRQAGASPFLKQLGAKPMDNGRHVKLRDSHGSDWSEWPDDLRVREFPNAFQATVLDKLDSEN